MKIAWVTPFSKRSAIGRSGQHIVEALAATEDVEIICFEQDELHTSTARVRRFRTAGEVDSSALARYDVLFYNFGNYLPFHRHIYELSRRVPGVAIIHDIVLHHFFAAYCLEQLQSTEQYLDLVKRYYGAQVCSRAMDSLNGRGGRIWETEAVMDCPLFEPVLPGMEGVIVHSDFFRERVDKVFAGPTAKISLAYSIDTKRPVRSRREMGLEDDSLVILTIGHVNPNKMITATIEALASLRTRIPKFRFVIAGPSGREYRQQIDDSIRQHGMEDHVTLTGEVSDDDLQGYLRHSDLCVNLRYPTIEGASASAIEEMLYAKPAIVANVGFYAELPDDCVIKIDPHSVPALRDALCSLAMDGARRVAMGEHARAYAEVEFSGKTYAAQALAFAAEVREARPVLGLTRRIAHECRQMQVEPGMTVLESLATRLHDLFGEAESPESRRR